MCIGDLTPVSNGYLGRLFQHKLPLGLSEGSGSSGNTRIASFLTQLRAQIHYGILDTMEYTNMIDKQTNGLLQNLFLRRNQCGMLVQQDGKTSWQNQLVQLVVLMPTCWSNIPLKISNCYCGVIFVWAKLKNLGPTKEILSKHRKKECFFYFYSKPIQGEKNFLSTLEENFN